MFASQKKNRFSLQHFYRIGMGMECVARHQWFIFEQISCGKTTNTNALHKRIIYGLFNASHNLYNWLSFRCALLMAAHIGA